MARSLTPAQLRRLDEWLHDLILKAEESNRDGRLQARKQIVEERIFENKTYRLEKVRCGKENCKCASGKLHGPYWYSYIRIKGRVKSQYVGKKLPGKAEKGSQVDS
jgi:hypothetical protein